jgi:pimeloyl-ACP methyl ester carboxylesterase
MFDNIKNFIGRIILSNQVSAKKNRHLFMPFDKAQEIGIVYNASESNNEQKIQQFASDLRNEGKKVYLLGFVNEKELDCLQKTNSDDFIKKLQLQPLISLKLRDYFENKYNEAMNNYSAFKAAATIDLPILVIHDEHDYEVPVKAGINIHKHVKNGEILLTQGLGHRKILGDASVIQKIIEFIKPNN